MHTPVHRLSRAHFDVFCAGAVDADAMAAIRAGQYSRRRLLLSALVDAADPDTTGPLASVEEAWQVLVSADERAPDVVEDAVMRPAMGGWLVRTVRRLHGVDLDGPPLWIEVGFLGSLVGAVAVRAGLSCAVEVPVVAGVVTLPTVGQVRFRDDPPGFASLSVTSDGVALRALPGGGPFDLPSVLDAPEFVPVHRHEVVSRGERIAVELDDATPYRRFAVPEPPHPLNQEQLTRWWRDLDGAWEVLTRWHPRFAAELSAGLATLTPIPPPSRVIGASAPGAFGGVMLSEAESPTVLATTLVHELQHSKLNALLDLVSLHTRDGAALDYAPWRDDPRPLTGLLHGIYAFTSDVEFWHAQRNWVPDTQATYSFVHRHLQVRVVVDSLRASPDLTRPGRDLVESVARRLTRCPLDDVPDLIIDAARTSVADHHARWRLRHVRPDDVDVKTAAWHAGAAIPAARQQKFGVIEPDRRAFTPSSRGRLLRMKVVDPTRFADVVDRPGDLCPADVAFVAGRHDEAVAAYVRRLRRTPLDGDAWVGLGLTLRAKGADSAGAFLQAPEVALGVREQIGSEVDVEPLEFLRWLGTEAT